MIFLSEVIVSWGGGGGGGDKGISEGGDGGGMMNLEMRTNLNDNNIAEILTVTTIT